MRTIILFLFSVSLLSVQAQSPNDTSKRWNGMDTSGLVSIDSITRGHTPLHRPLINLLVL